MSEKDVMAMARLRGLAIAPDHLPGVARNMAALEEQIALIVAAPIEAAIEPAPVFRP